MGDTRRRRYALRSESAALPHPHKPPPSAQQLFNDVSRAIRAAKEETHLSVDDVDASAAALVVDSLDETPAIEAIRPRLGYNSFTKTLDVVVLPTLTHDCPHAWLDEEIAAMTLAAPRQPPFLTVAESRMLRRLSGPTFRGFHGPYAASAKQPDMAILPAGQSLPSVVIESGWSESLAKLHRDMRLWLVGGRGQVQLVLLAKWTRPPPGQNAVRGVLEAWDLDHAGNDRLLQTEVIFPTPHPGSERQTLSITRGQLFGPSLPSGRDANDTYGLSVSRLRIVATDVMRLDGNRPAP